MTTPAFGDSLDKTEELPKLSYDLTADKVLKEIDRRGPAPVVWELFDRIERWYDLLRNVAGGDPAWLEVAARLRPASDAAATEELSDAVTEAMTISPERVLEMIGETNNSFHTVDLCCVRLLVSVAADRLIAETDRKIRALSRVKRRDLAKVRDRCINTMKKCVQQNIPNGQGPK
jgi:hypothetical protein